MSNDDERRPRRPIHVGDLPWEEWSEGTRFGGRVRELVNSKRDGLHIGILIEELQPGKQSCPAHYHLKEEEHVWVLEGRVTLRLGDERIVMKPGDFVTFPAGQRAGHCLINDSDAPSRYLVIGERIGDDVCVYTDTNKVLVRTTGEIYDKASTREYWEGEETD